MTTATTKPDLTAAGRRHALRFGLATAAATAAPAIVAASPDTKLIALCRHAAEREIRAWYAATVTDGAPFGGVDIGTLERVAGIPATTPAGWQAKALLFAAVHTDAYDGTDQLESTIAAELLAYLLRDMIAPARRAIIDRCREEFGALGEGYSDDARWTGPGPEAEADRAAREAEEAAAVAEMRRRTTVETMTRSELENTIASYAELRDTAAELYQRAAARLAELGGAV